MEPKHLKLLHAILSQPAAPFREELVADAILQALDEADVPHFRDPIGNIIVGVGSKAAYLRKLREKTTEPVRIFMAHMDHPGFHGVKWRNDRALEVRWHGGSPKALLEGSSVWLASTDGWRGEGVLIEAQVNERAIETAVVELASAPTSAPKAEKLYGGFRFRAPHWEENGILYTKAADDLVGVFAITAMAIDLAKKFKRGGAPFLGLITRAEEVGFIGAIAHFNLGWLTQARRPFVVVSLECSRQLPGAEIGKGPVVRLGDRFTVFDPASLQVALKVASKVLPDKHQRKLMDGGTCEATPSLVFGFPAIGMSVPLGNYHNESFEGGPDSRGERGPGPEFVSLSDVEGLLGLCHGLLKPGLGWNNPWKEKRTQLRASLSKYRPLLRTPR